MSGGRQTWFSLLIALGMIFLAMARLLESLWRGTAVFVWTKKDGPFLLLLLWCLVALKLPFSPPDALDSFLILAGCFCTFLLARTLSFEGSAIPLILSLSLAGTVYVLTGILQLAEVLPHGWWKPPAFMASTFVNHNHFAAYLEILLPLSSALAVAAPLGPFRRLLVIFSSVVMATGLLLTDSRGGWLSIVSAFALGLGWWLLRKREKKIAWNWVGVGLAAFLLAGAGFLIVQPPVLDRAATLLQVSNDVSFQTRLVIWKSTLPLLKENPLLGHGLDSFVFAFPRFRAPGLYRLIDFAHNEYLQIMVELGLVGLVLVVLSSLLVGQRMMRLVRLSQSSWKQALGLGGLIGLGSLALHSVGDFPWRLPAVAIHACAVMGLVTGIQFQKDPSPLRVFRCSFPNSGAGKTMRWAVLTALVLGFVFFSGGFSSLVWADFLAKQARTFGKIRNSERAAALYREAIRWAPFRSRYQKNLGDQLIHLAKKNQGYQRDAILKEAAQAYQAALELNPHDVWSAYGRGLAFRRLGDLKEGEHWLLSAVRWDPQNPLFLKDLAELQLILGKSSEAAQAFIKSAQLAKPFNFFPLEFASLDEPEHFMEWGESVLFQGHARFAENIFRVVQEMKPSHPGAQMGLALSALSQGQVERARELMRGVKEPKLQAKWHATLAQQYLNKNNIEAAEAAISTVFELDPDNVLAHHLQLRLAESGRAGLSYQSALKQSLALNRPPVFVKEDPQKKLIVVWEPEKGNYSDGHKKKEGWKLSENGALAQSVVLPVGRVRLQITAAGTKLRGAGPSLTVSWNRHQVLAVVVQEETWTTYETKIRVSPGETILRLAFTNDQQDPKTGEDRNLLIDKVVASWEVP